MNEFWQLSSKSVYVNTKGFNFENKHCREKMHYLSPIQRNCKAN